MITLAAPFSRLDESQLLPPLTERERPLVPPQSPSAVSAGTFADRCALLALDLRTALEDRLPKLAALATCWFDADDDEASEGGEAPPRDPVCVRIDLSTFAAGLARRDGLPATPEDAASWLVAVGFQHFGDLWVGEREDLRLIGTNGIEAVGTGCHA